MVEDIFRQLIEAVQAGDPDLASSAAKKTLAAGVSPDEAIEQGLAKGVRIVGDKFEKGEAFITDLAMAAEAMKSALKILQPELERQKSKSKTLGTIVLGTVEGDIHDIGKNLVGTMLTASGFDVIDLGSDIAANKFVDAARKEGAQVIGASALLTTTRSKQKEIIDALQRLGLRGEFRVIVGGAPVSQHWAGTIGADGYGASAVEAVRVVKAMLKVNE